MIFKLVLWHWWIGLTAIAEGLVLIFSLGLVWPNWRVNAIKRVLILETNELTRRERVKDNT